MLGLFSQLLIGRLPILHALPESLGIRQIGTKQRETKGHFGYSVHFVSYRQTP